jgi:polyisoprenoid-binding protein YceI
LQSDENPSDEIVPTHRIEGNLTIKGVTKRISFPAQVGISNNVIMAKTPQFTLNRTEWSVNYGSKSIFANLKDNFIHDEMGIKIHLQSK